MGSNSSPEHDPRAVSAGNGHGCDGGRGPRGGRAGNRLVNSGLGPAVIIGSTGPRLRALRTYTHLMPNSQGRAEGHRLRPRFGGS